MKFIVAPRASRPHVLAHFTGASLGSLLRLGALSAAVATVCLVQVVSNPVPVVDLPAVAMTVEAPDPVPVAQPEAAKTKTVSITPAGALNEDEIKKSDWFSRAAAQVEAAEYEVYARPEGLFGANNAAHNFSVDYNAETVRFFDASRNVDADGGRTMATAYDWTWKTVGMGREGKIGGVYGASVSGQNHRVVYDRYSVIEYYDNNSDGIEQSFVIKEAPSGSGSVVVRGHVESDTLLTAYEPGEKAVLFKINKDGGAVAMRYCNLTAFDARRHVLPAEMKVNGNTIDLVVDDTGAEYPLTIDPLTTTSPDWQADGSSITGGNQPPKFGCSLAGGDFNGDGVGDLAVGAPGRDNGPLPDVGALYVYYGIPDLLSPGTGRSNGLSTTPGFIYFPNSNLDQYGYIGLNMVSADFNNDGITDLAVSAPTHYGSSISIPNVGAVYIYYGASTTPANPPTGWAAGLLPSVTIARQDITGTVAFGLSLTVGNFKTTNSPGKDLAVSSRWDGSLNLPTYHPGKVYVFYTGTANKGFVDGSDNAVSSLNATACSWQAYSLAKDDFGNGIGMGMSQADYNIYNGSQDNIVAHHALAAGNIDGNAGDELVIGAFDMADVYFAGVQSVIKGGIMVFVGSAGGLPDYPSSGAFNGSAAADIDATWKLVSSTANDRLGTTVLCGNFNGDGFDDLVASQPGYTSGQTREGRILMWKGASGLGPQGTSGNWTLANPFWTAESDQADAGVNGTSYTNRVGFGWSMAAGNIDGDVTNYQDIIVGSRLQNNIYTDDGAVYLWYGSSVGLNGANVPGNPANTQWTPVQSAGNYNYEFGDFLIVAKSLDSDSLPDIVCGIGKYAYGTSYGQARVYTVGLHYTFNTQSVAVTPNEATGGTGVFNFPLSSVVANGTSTSVQTVRWRTVDGTALSTSPGTPGTPDYTAVTNGLLTFNAGSTVANSSVPASISITDDTVNEAVESFTIYLEFPSTGRVGVGTGDSPTASRYCTVTIDDNDPVPFGRVCVSAVNSTERDPIVENESPLVGGDPGTGPVTWTVWVCIVDQFGSLTFSGQQCVLYWQTKEKFPTPIPPTPYAKAGQDFTAAGPTAVSIPTGQQFASFNITFRADLIDEEDEEFVLTMTSTNSCEIYGGIGAPPTTRDYTVKITDDDAPPVVCFDMDAYSVVEGNVSGSTFFTVTIKLLDPITGLPRASEKRVEIHFSTEILDYPAAASLAFQPLAAESPGMVPTYGVSADYIPVPNGVEIFDYNGTSGTITPPSTTTKTEQFIINGDLIYELDEIFRLVIHPDSQNCQLASGGMIGAVVAPYDSTVTIMDDEDTGVPGTSNVPTCQFSVANTNVPEPAGAAPPIGSGAGVAGTDVTVTITLSAKHERWVYDPNLPSGPPILNGDMVSVNYQANTGSSGVTFGGPFYAAGDDLIKIDPTLMPLPWLALSVTFQVHLWPDSLNEAAEAVDLALTSSDDIAMGVITVATITILDDDGGAVPFVRFALASVDVSETAVNAIININLVDSLGNPAASGQAVRITCSTSDGTAQAPGDYTTQSNQVTFNPGQTSRNFVVPILDDNIRETTEYIVLTLSSPIAGNLGNPSAMTVNILDNEPDPVVQFKRSTFGVSEAGIAATINVTLSIQSALPVTIQYITTEGTATDGLDYNNVAGTLTFPGGSTEQVFTVPILNDTLIELDETVLMTLSNPINASIGSITTATLTIVNDESGGSGGGGGVNKGGGGCAGSEYSSTGWAGIIAVLTMLVGMRMVRRRKA